MQPLPSGGLHFHVTSRRWCRTATCAQSFEQKRLSPWGVYFGDKLQQTSSSIKVTNTCLWKITIQTMLKSVLYIEVSILLRPSREWRKCSEHMVYAIPLSLTAAHNLLPQNSQFLRGSNMLHCLHCVHSPMARSSGQYTYRPWRQNLTMST